MEYEPKISMVEAYLFVALSLLADILSIIPIVNWFVAAITIPFTQYYLYTKGVRGNQTLALYIIEAIPALSILPAYTVRTIAIIYLDRHPKLSSAAMLGTSKLKGVKTAVAPAKEAAAPIASIDSIRKKSETSREVMTNISRAALFFITLMLGLISGPRTFAQTAPQLFLTWRSRAYVQPSYIGKVLPLAGAPLEASVTMIDNGKIVDLSRQTIRWLRNNRLLRTGIGLQTIAIPTDPLLRDAETRLKVAVVGYKGADYETNLVLLPARPEVVIRSPYAGRMIPSGNSVFQSRFYHWSISSLDELRIRWSLQGQSIESSGAEGTLETNIPDAAAGDLLTLNLSARNNMNELEFANTTMQLRVTRH